MVYKFYMKLSLYILLVSFSYLYSAANVLEDNKHVLNQIAKHAQLIAQERDGKGPHFIGIAGCTGVGKSYFTRELFGLLEKKGIKVALLRLDDFLNPDYFDSDHFHPRLEHALAHSIIEKIKCGEKFVKKPAWNPRHLRPPSKKEEIFLLEGIDLILFEGEFTLCGDVPYDFKKYSAITIFIDAEDEVIFEWKWQRRNERPLAQKTKDEFIEHSKPFVQKYRAYVSSSRTTATYLILKDADHRYTLHKK